MKLMLSAGAARATGYFDSHPGMDERLARLEPTVVNQHYDSIAAKLVEKTSWKALSPLVNQWLKVNPDSARAWYYKGILLRAGRRPEALPAFEKAVAYDPGFHPARIAQCVELYGAGRERDSIVCAEYIPRGALFEEYQAATFKHPVFVGGMNDDGRKFTEQDVKIVQDLCRAGLC